MDETDIKVMSSVLKNQKDFVGWATEQILIGLKKGDSLKSSIENILIAYNGWTKNKENSKKQWVIEKGPEGKNLYIISYSGVKRKYPVDYTAYATYSLDRATYYCNYLNKHNVYIIQEDPERAYQIVHGEEIPKQLNIRELWEELDGKWREFINGGSL